MSEPVTSDISVTRVGTSVRNKKSIYTATKVTKTQSNPPTYKTEIVRYSDAKGNNPVTIGTRNSDTGKIEFNDNASATEKRYTASLGKTSTGQVKSIESDVASNASDKAALNKSAGKGNEAEGKGDDSTTPSVAAATEDKEGTRNEFPKDLIFPIGIDNVDRDVIKFDMIKYIPTGFGMGSEGVEGMGGKSGRKTGGKSIGSVILPIPGGITDTNAVDWGSGTMNPIQAAAANFALTSLQKGFSEGAEVAKDLAGAAAKAGPDVKKGIAAAIAGGATQIGKQALQRGEGMVLNPNMELLFNGPQLRNFGFTFKLSPRNAREAQMAVKIIKFFKQGMSPIRSKSNFFLKAPHTFNLKYIRGKSRGEQKFLNKFKECALTNATVQYTPDGNYNTFTDGVMASYSLQLTFNELTPIYNDDYKNGPFDASIGF